MWNPLTAGCFTGGVLAWGSGPIGMGMGCAGLAGFALAIDRMPNIHLWKLYVLFPSVFLTVTL